MQNFLHHQEHARRQSSLVNDLNKSLNDVKGEVSKRGDDLTERIDTIEKRLATQSHAPHQLNLDSSVSQKLSRLEAQEVNNQSVIKALRKEAHELRGEIQALRREFQQLQRTGQPFSRHPGITGKEAQG